MTEMSLKASEIIAAFSAMELAEKLLAMAAKRSTETPFGWSQPDCEALQEAARLLRAQSTVASSAKNAALLQIISDAWGFIAHGAASEYAKQEMLNRMTRAMDEHGQPRAYRVLPPRM